MKRTFALAGPVGVVLRPSLCCFPARQYARTSR
jgi:hypothetical protein